MNWELFDSAKPVGDVAAVATFVAWAANWLPSVATAVTIIWGILRCYDAWLDIQKKRKEIKNG